MLWSDLHALAPELLLSGAAMVLLLLGVFMPRDRMRLIAVAAIAAFFGAILLAVFATPATGTVFGGAFAADTFAQVGRVFVYTTCILSLLLSLAFFERERLAKFEYPVLVLLAAVGMGLMVSANDLIAVYMGIELQSLALYVMAAFNRDSRRSTEAGLKYFVLGALSSGLLLYGASLIYGFTGSVEFSGIAAALDDGATTVGVAFGLVFLIAGLAFKVSGAPFHMWTPDVYEGAPTPVTAFFAAAPKFAAMLLFVRVMTEAFPSILAQWQPILWLIAALSMLVGAVFALMQTNIKRLMAYSSIGHVGYALIGLVAGTETGVAAVVSYLGIYVLMTLGTFACILCMRRPEGMAENISDLSGLMRTRPGLGLAFTVLFFSLAGIPPMLGFFAKLAVFTAGIEAGLMILVLIGVVSSVIATFYYLGVIRAIWFAEPAPAFVADTRSLSAVTASVIAVVVVGGLIVIVGPLYQLAETAARALFEV